MSKLSLLKECITLMLTEVAVEGPEQPFQLTSPAQPLKKGHDPEFTIYREFPIVPTPEMMQALKLTDGDLEDGILWGEQEIGLDCELSYEKEERATWTDPGSPGGYSIDNWTPVTLNGVALSPADSRALESYMGDLTDREYENITDQAAANAPEPDYDDYDRY